jgi:hypothetical protein
VTSDGGLESADYKGQPLRKLLVVGVSGPSRKRRGLPTPVMLQEHPDRLFDYVPFRNG